MALTHVLKPYMGLLEWARVRRHEFVRPLQHATEPKQLSPTGKPPRNRDSHPPVWVAFTPTAQGTHIDKSGAVALITANASGSPPQRSSFCRAAVREVWSSRARVDCQKCTDVGPRVSSACPVIARCSFAGDQDHVGSGTTDTNVGYFDIHGFGFVALRVSSVVREEDRNRVAGLHPGRLDDDQLGPDFCGSVERPKGPARYRGTTV